MATVNLTIPITDSEQAAIQAIVTELGLTLTSAQVKAWLEHRGKALLKEHIQTLLRNHRQEVEWLASRSAEQELEAGWQDDPLPEGVPDTSIP